MKEAAFCNQCGAPLSGKEKFCSRCGAKIVTSIEGNIKLIPYDWILVFLFASYFITDQIFSYLVSSGSLVVDISVQDLWGLLALIYIVINGIIALLDSKQLKDKLKVAPSTFFALFLVPVYLYKRGTITKVKRYSFWSYMGILFLMIFIENSQSLFGTSLFTPNYQKIEVLKSVEFEGTNMPFSDFIKNKAQQINYSTFSNETGNYVAVTLASDKINGFPKLIYNFKVKTTGELYNFLLTDATITFDGNTWKPINQNIANILLFSSDKTLSSIKPTDLQNPIDLLSDSGKIEGLKSVQFPQINSALGEYIERRWPNANYGVSFNTYQDVVAVTISQNADIIYPEKVTFFFSIAINEEMMFLSHLDHMVVYYRGKEPLSINMLYAAYFLFMPQDSDIMKKTAKEVLSLVNPSAL